jgi:hypothetical protein
MLMEWCVFQAEAAAAAAAAQNGHAKTNDAVDSKAGNGSVKNGAANGAANGVSKKQRAADYYINGDLASDVHYRHTANGKTTANGSA